jgi:hypothetical protein
MLLTYPSLKQITRAMAQPPKPLQMPTTTTGLPVPNPISDSSPADKVDTEIAE